MVFDLDAGTLFMVVASIIGAFWAILKLVIAQYEKRQDLRFTDLADAITAQGRELDEHMRKQDTVLAEVRRVEGSALSEIRRVESELHQCRIDAANRYMTKDDARGRHQEILDAIHGLANRIDSLHGRNGVTQQ